MTSELTIVEVAALLTERGLTDRRGGAVKPDTVKHQVRAGHYPNARLHKAPGMGRGLWLIPLSDVDAYLTSPALAPQPDAMSGEDHHS